MKVEITAHCKGHKITCTERDESGVYSVWRYAESGKRFSTEDSLACVKCGKVSKGHEPDPCMGNLPGVENACCGHGIENDAYISFDNGITVRGTFTSVEKK